MVLAAKLSLEMVIIIAIGYAARKAGILGENFEKPFSSLIMKVILPLMIIRSMMNEPFSMQGLRDCGYLVLLALGYLIVCFAMGQAYYILAKKTTSAQICRYGMIFTNFTFFGMPVVEYLYGTQALFYFVVFLVPIRVVFYSMSKPLISPPGTALEKPTLGQKLKGWFSAPVIGVLVGLLIYVTQMPLPAAISDVINLIGSTAGPMGMLLCGINLGKFQFKKLIRIRYLKLPLLRSFFVPAVITALAWALHLPWSLAMCVILCAALPVASLVAAYTIQYNPNPEAQFEASGGVLISTIFSVVTLPLWAYVLEALF